MDQDDPRQLLIKVAEILDRLNIPYMITGGIAVLVWGRPRFTADIDVIVELKPEHIDKLEIALRQLSSVGYIDKDAMEEALSRHGEFNFIDGSTGMKVDFWILSKDSFDASRLKRRIAKEILGQKVYFISPEDLILSKLRWYQKSQSTRHLEDAESVIKVSGGKLDVQYLKTWAEKQGTFSVLGRFLSAR